MEGSTNQLNHYTNFVLTFNNPVPRHLTPCTYSEIEINIVMRQKNCANLFVIIRLILFYPKTLGTVSGRILLPAILINPDTPNSSAKS